MHSSPFFPPFFSLATTPPPFMDRNCSVISRSVLLMCRSGRFLKVFLQRGHWQTWSRKRLMKIRGSILISGRLELLPRSCRRGYPSRTFSPSQYLLMQAMQKLWPHGVDEGFVNTSKQMEHSNCSSNRKLPFNDILWDEKTETAIHLNFRYAGKQQQNSLEDHSLLQLNIYHKISLTKVSKPSEPECVLVKS